jgi:fatty-acyl-CoA synthase
MTGSGEVVTYRQLDERSNQLAQLLRARGLAEGDHIAILMENRPEYFVVLWAALRSGLYLTTINRYLTVEEAAYILEDCDAQCLVTSSALAAVAGPAGSSLPIRLSADGGVEGFEDLAAALEGRPTTPVPTTSRGDLMLYSSGTTGRPKGIKRPLSGQPPETPAPLIGMVTGLYGMDADTTYLSPAPLYHTAPLGYCMAVQSIGGTAVVMEHFDALDALAAIEAHQVTHAQFVPTMFVRMLKLPEADRRRHDLSSLQVAIHAAAPCPVAVKQQMLEWWGPIVHEYYGGTEGNGVTYVSPQDWLTHPGTVGRPIFGTVHVCDADGAEVPVGTDGIVYFEQPRRPFSYHKDESKTAAASHPDHEGWTALGDIGHVDEDGFLYLTDRASFMIISGGVNVYPQEIEDCLVMHPKVADVAVIGVPDDEMGEAVKAIVEPAAGVAPTPELADELRAYAREHLAKYKVPRTVDFTTELPRLPTGKLYKRKLVEQYR